MSDTTKLTSFPDRVDTFERVSDLSVQEGTFEKSKIYKGYIDSENYSQAEQYLKDNEDLARCAVNAGMFNKHSDALTALEEKAIEDRHFAENGLKSLDTKLDTVHSEFSKISGSSGENAVFLNTCIDGASVHTAKIKGSSNILVDCNSNKELEISLKKTTPTLPIISISTPKSDNAFTQIETMHSNGNQITRGLCQKSFYISNSDYFSQYFIETYLESFILIPNTNWINIKGWSTGGMNSTQRNLFSIEGSLKTRTDTSVNVYPIGYNDGKIAVNACLHTPQGVTQNEFDDSHLFIAILYKGISKEDIVDACGIIKYTTETA